MRTKRKGLLLCLLTLLMCACVAAGMTAVFGASGTDGYRYLLQFSDDFNGTVQEDWAVIEGGSSYSYAADEQTVRGWRFGGENHIAYKTNTTTDYGKFLYGNAGSANYMFEVKVKADVPEDNLQQYLDENAANLGAGLTLNTHLPFFVTDPSPDTNTHTFRGRSVCFSNYAILGRYVLTPEIFDILENLHPGYGGEIQLTDGLRELCKKSRMVAVDFEGRRYDTGNLSGFLEATIDFALDHPATGPWLRRFIKEKAGQL